MEPKPDPHRPAELLSALYAAAVDAALPAHCLPGAFPTLGAGMRPRVFALGKAALPMAEAALNHYGSELSGGLIVAHAAALREPEGEALAQCLAGHFQIFSAAHPVPDASSLAAGRAALAWAAGLQAQDHAILLISGGGSALACVPIDGLALSDKQELHRRLLASGASISQMNFIRRHLSAIKGGRLAWACRPAPVSNLLLSDIPGDVAGDIASGPGIPNESLPSEALDLIDRLGIEVSPALRAALNSVPAKTPGRTEFLLPDDSGAAVALPTIQIVASARDSLRAAQTLGESLGLEVVVLSDRLEAEAAPMGRMLAQMALFAAADALERPRLILSGGEAGVALGPSVDPDARGGRSAETLLSFGLALADSGLEAALRVHALMADTDGIDGQGPEAGALWGPALTQAVALNPQAARHALARHDAHGFFAAHGMGFCTGPTGTNVNDFRAILVMPSNDPACRKLRA